MIKDKMFNSALESLERSGVKPVLDESARNFLLACQNYSDACINKMKEPLLLTKQKKRDIVVFMGENA